MRQLGMGRARIGLSAVAAIFGVGLLAAGPAEAGFLDKINPFKSKAPEASATSPDMQDFLVSGACPELAVRSGTEAIIIRDKPNDPSPDSVRYQASITKTARECHYVNGGLQVKVGVAGRVVAGPKGGPGKIVVPVRVVVLRGDGSPMISELRRQEVVISPPNLFADFAVVVDVAVNTSPEESARLDLLAGLDEKPGPDKPKKK